MSALLWGAGAVTNEQPRPRTVGGIAGGGVAQAVAETGDVGVDRPLVNIDVGSQNMVQQQVAG